MTQTILITGASSGIGKAIALAFAAPGTRIILNSFHNKKGLEETASMASQKGADCITVQADVSEYDACRLLWQQAVSRFGAVDLLINNAGISHIGLFQDMEPSQWRHLMDVNLGSVMNLCHLAIPSMVQRHQGRIINISSVWGSVGASCEAVYSASKGAVNSFTKALAKELAPSGIQVNAIAFGAIETPMNAWLSNEDEDALRAEIPASRLGTPEEAAQLVSLIARAPDYLTGQIITMDGGWQ